MFNWLLLIIVFIAALWFLTGWQLKNYHTGRRGVRLILLVALVYVLIRALIHWFG